MTLQGTRDEWEELLRRNDEGFGLKDEHVACIQHALGLAPADARTVEVDALLPGLQQVRDRMPDIGGLRTVAASIADKDESWWIHRARTLGLSSIVPVGPWPRDPDGFFRPPGYLHRYGPDATFPDSVDPTR